MLTWLYSVGDTKEYIKAIEDYRNRKKEKVEKLQSKIDSHDHSRREEDKELSSKEEKIAKEKIKSLNRRLACVESAVSENGDMANEVNREIIGMEESQINIINYLQCCLYPKVCTSKENAYAAGTFVSQLSGWHELCKQMLRTIPSFLRTCTGAECSRLVAFFWQFMKAKREDADGNEEKRQDFQANELRSFIDDIVRILFNDAPYTRLNIGNFLSNAFDWERQSTEMLERIKNISEKQQERSFQGLKAKVEKILSARAAKKKEREASEKNKQSKYESKQSEGASATSSHRQREPSVHDESAKKMRAEDSRTPNSGRQGGKEHGYEALSGSSHTSANSKYDSAESRKRVFNEQESAPNKLSREHSPERHHSSSRASEQRRGEDAEKGKRTRQSSRSKSPHPSDEKIHKRQRR